MATELENLVPEADVEVEGMRGPKGDKGDSYVLTEADKEEIARKVDKIIDAETDKTLTLSGKPADAKAAGDAIDDLKADLSQMNKWSDLAVDIFDSLGSEIAFMSQTAGEKWNDLILAIRGELVTKNVVTSGNHFEMSNPSNYAVVGREYNCVISPSSHYNITSVTASMGNESISPVDNQDGTYTIYIASVSNDISINVESAMDSSSIIYHTENIVCDGTQEAIQTPLQFSSPSANGVTDSWSVCVRATQDARHDYGYVICSGDIAARLSFDSYAPASATKYRTRWQSTQGAGYSSGMIGNDVAIVFTHKAGDNKTVTAHFIPYEETVPTTKVCTATNGVHYLDYNNSATPLCVGNKSVASETSGFIGTIKDVTILNFELTQEEAYEYIRGGVL